MSKITPITSPVIERRYTPGRVERRAAEGDKPSRTVRGYAAVFGKRSENLGGATYQFFETIEAGAFDDVLKDDVRALFNHDANLILARSKGGSGTLRIGVDDEGLWYEFDAPETRAGDDLLVSLDRGDVDQSSFGFSVMKEGQEWRETTKDGITVVERKITKVSRLYDVSPVTYPAYPDTTAAVRSLQAAKPEEPTPDPSPTFPQRAQWAARFGF